GYLRGTDTLQVELRLHDLLGRNGRILKDQVQVLPAGMRLQEGLRKRRAGEVRKKQRIADHQRRLRELRILVHFFDRTGANEGGDVADFADAQMLIAQRVIK